MSIVTNYSPLADLQIDFLRGIIENYPMSVPSLQALLFRGYVETQASRDELKMLVKFTEKMYEIQNQKIGEELEVYYDDLVSELAITNFQIPLFIKSNGGGNTGRIVFYIYKSKFDTLSSYYLQKNVEDDYITIRAMHSNCWLYIHIDGNCTGCMHDDCGAFNYVVSNPDAIAQIIHWITVLYPKLKARRVELKATYQ
jgi:hypothetical protein